MNVSGKSVEELMNLDSETLTNLTQKELRQVTSRLVSAVNKRIRRLESYANKKGIEIPSLQSISKNKANYFIYKNGVKQFSIKGIDDDEVMGAYSDLKRFMDFRTSSITEYKKFRKELDKKISESVDFDYNELSNEDKNEIWDVYAKVKETNRGIFQEMEGKGKGTNGVVVQAIYNLQSSKLSKGEIVNKVDDLVEELFAKEKTDEEIKQYLANEFSIVR